MMRDMDAMCRIGRPRPARHKTDSGFSGKLAIGFGHDRGPAFVATDHDIDVGIDHGIERRQIGFPRHAGDTLDAIDFQLINKNLTAGTHF